MMVASHISLPFGIRRHLGMPHDSFEDQALHIEQLIPVHRAPHDVIYTLHFLFCDELCHSRLHTCCRPCNICASFAAIPCWCWIQVWMRICALWVRLLGSLPQPSKLNGPPRWSISIAWNTPPRWLPFLSCYSNLALLLCHLMLLCPHRVSYVRPAAPLLS